MEIFSEFGATKVLEKQVYHVVTTRGLAFLI